jgi:cell division inhibitor SulA
MVVGDERKLVVVRIKSGAIDKQLQDHVERLKVRASGVVISFLKKMGEDADEHLVKNVERWKVRASVVVIPSSNEDGRGCRQASGKVERLK